MGVEATKAAEVGDTMGVGLRAVLVEESKTVAGETAVMMAAVMKAVVEERAVASLAGDTMGVGLKAGLVEERTAVAEGVAVMKAVAEMADMMAEVGMVGATVGKGGTGAEMVTATMVVGVMVVGTQAAWEEEVRAAEEVGVMMAVAPAMMVGT